MNQNNSEKSFDQFCLYTSEKVPFSQMPTTPSEKSIKQGPQSFKFYRGRAASEDIPKENILHLSNYLENQFLKRENDLLKTQMQQLRRENISLKRQIEKIVKKPPIPDVKFRQKVKHNQKQILLYKQIIQKLESRIQIVLVENQNLSEIIEGFQKKCQKLQNVQMIVNQIHRIEGLAFSLQGDIRKDDNQWELYKELWLAQKQYYKQIIRKLQFQIGCQNS